MKKTNSKWTATKTKTPEFCTPTFYCVDVGLIGNVTLTDNKY